MTNYSFGFQKYKTQSTRLVEAKRAKAVRNANKAKQVKKAKKVKQVKKAPRSNKVQSRSNDINLRDDSDDTYPCEGEGLGGTCPAGEGDDCTTCCTFEPQEGGWDEWAWVDADGKKLTALGDNGRPYGACFTKTETSAIDDCCRDIAPVYDSTDPIAKNFKRPYSCWERALSGKCAEEWMTGYCCRSCAEVAGWQISGPTLPDGQIVSPQVSDICSSCNDNISTQRTNCKNIVDEDVPPFPNKDIDGPWKWGAPFSCSYRSIHGSDGDVGGNQCTDSKTAEFMEGYCCETCGNCGGSDDNCL
jgi:hypothetical protein